MLERILEPEVMDTPEEARDYDSMDHSAVNQVFVADFLKIWNKKGPIIDLGTGTALIPIEFCRQSPEGEIIAIDAAENMLKLARENVSKHKLDKRIRLELVDAKRIDYRDGSIVAIMSNSIIHHIPEPGNVFAEIARLAAEGATIFVRDLMRPRDREELNRIVQTYAGDANEHQQKMFAESLHAALTLEEVRAYVKNFGFDPSQVTQTTDRHWTWSVPARSR